VARLPARGQRAARRSGDHRRRDRDVGAGGVGHAEAHDAAPPIVGADDGVQPVAVGAAAHAAAEHREPQRPPVDDDAPAAGATDRHDPTVAGVRGAHAARAPPDRER
jgi:hypothetical protein